MALTRRLLDSSALSAFFRGDPRAAEEVALSSEVVLPWIVLGELQAGYRLGQREAENRNLLRRFLSTPRVRTVGADEETADRYALLFADLKRAGTPVPTNDIWIAASAMQHGLEILTADEDFRSFRGVAVRIL